MANTPLPCCHWPNWVTSLCLSLITLLFPDTSRSQIITTVAGSQWVFRDDGNIATTSALGFLSAVTVDPSGNLVATDAGNHVVVKISTSGVLSVIAGNGIAGFSGDGGPATRASLSSPAGVAVDMAGNIFISDTENFRVRKVNTAGIITTVAGNGRHGFSGDGGPASVASLTRPYGLALSADGDLYIADSQNHRIRKLDPEGRITTIAGTGVAGSCCDETLATSARLNWPVGVVLDKGGNLYIADKDNDLIRRVGPDGRIDTAAGNGFRASTGDGRLATTAALAQPWGITLDGAGNLYIAEALGNRIRTVDTTGTISTLAGTGYPGYSGDGAAAMRALLGNPRGVATDHAGTVFIADSLNYRIRKVNSEGVIVTVAGNGQFRFSGDFGPATSASLHLPGHVVADRNGNLYIADSYNQRIRRVAASGTIATVAGSEATGFLGDGGLATRAALGVPRGVAASTDGNIFIADTLNSRVRKVDPAGIITTVAGNGNLGFSGDQGPATQASFAGPVDIAIDGGGNLYVSDSYNHRIRKIPPSGLVTTFAGNGLAGFGGDNGPAVGASLNYPARVTVDSFGSLYIADNLNFRIRKVSSTGSITTIAGSGAKGYSGDGGPAIEASFNAPSSVAVDASGNLYVADIVNHRIRRIRPNGTIDSVVGRGAPGFSGDGGLALNATIDSPTGVAVDNSGNLLIADQGNNSIRKVLALPPTFSVAPSTLSFTTRVGLQALASNLIAITTAVPGLAWSANSSVPWVTLSVDSGTMPASIGVAVNPINLTPGTYRGAVTVTAPLASPSTHTVEVELTVLPPSASRLEVDPSAITFETTPGSGPGVQTLRIGNRGNDTLSWIARAETLSGGNWLHLSATSGSASASSPTTLQVRADASGLAAGVYSGLITVESPGSPPQSVAVDLLLSQVTQSISVSQTALQFTAVEGEETAERQKLAVVNSGQGVMNWTVRAETVNGGNWLVVSPSSGQSEAGSILVPEVDVSVNARGLRRGTYAGLLQVSAPGAANSPRLVTVTLTVLAGGSKPGTRLSPPGLIFTGRVGSGSPSSQLVRLTTSNPEQVEARGQAYTVSGGDWLQVLPTNLVVSASDPRTVVVQPVLGNLAPGEYRGALTYQFSDGSPTQAVNIYFVVVGGTAEAALSGSGLACAARKLVAVDRSLGPSFKAEVGAGTNLEVQVVDDCGNAVDDATVVATFSNGDQAVTLTHLREGIYAGIWRPLTAAEQVTVTLRISQASLPGVELLTQGKVEAGAGRAVIFPGGIVNGASYAGGALAPGSIVSLFGRKLSTSTATATSLPLSTSLGGIRVQVGGVEMPLFYTGEGQINAQLPFELTPNTRPQVVVKGADFVTAAETITVAAARPGIFTLSQDGKGQGAILDSQGRVVDSNNPAAAGEVVAVYCTGLGATNPAVSSGQPAPGQEPLARVTVPVEATVGGKPARVQFAGLAPGFVGLYQVNVQIPEGLSPGASVTVVLRQNDTRGNPVALAVR